MADEEKKPEGGKSPLDMERERRTIDNEKIDQWLRTKGRGGGLMACPMCGTGSWAYYPYVFRSLQKPYASEDFIEASCTNCGFLARFAMDVVDPKFSGGGDGEPN